MHICSWHIQLFRVSWFVRLLAAKGSQAMPELSTVQAQFSLNNHNIAKEPQKHGKCQETVA